jgi:hypothetical protein
MHPACSRTLTCLTSSVFAGGRQPVSVPRDSVYASAAGRAAERGTSDELLPGVRASLCGDEQRSWHDETVYSHFTRQRLLVLHTCSSCSKSDHRQARCLT